MIENLEELNTKMMISIDNSDSYQLTGLEDFEIANINIIEIDDTKTIIIESDDFFIIATNISGDEVYAICENYNDDEQYFTDDECFMEEIELAGGEEVSVYTKHAEIADESSMEDNLIAEYKSNDWFNFLLIRYTNNQTITYRGVEISDNDIIL